MFEDLFGPTSDFNKEIDSIITDNVVTVEDDWDTGAEASFWQNEAPWKNEIPDCVWKN